MANLTGTTGDDIIDGTAVADIISGGKGDDIISGGGGNDVINGGAGADILLGDAGSDIISGGAGDDIIDGGAGSDALTGGNGSDLFMILDASKDTIMDFNAAQGDQILIDTISGVSSIRDLVISENTSTHTVTITAPSNPNFQLTLLNATAADVMNSLTVACLLRGTLVQTPAGEVAVEALSIGDLVTTVDGAAKAIKWIGTRSFGGAFVRGNDRVTPVQIRAGALGVNTPSRDLFVSPEHAVLVEGVLVPAEKLVNGSSILRASGIELVDYFHLEFETPEVVITNGAPTETYVDEGSRRMFANWQEYVDLYGDVPGAQEAARRFPLLRDGDQVEALRARLMGAADKAA